MPAPAEPHRRGVLPPLATAAARAVLSPPRVPESAVATVALARHAARLVLPVRIEAPVAAGRILLARALHTESGRPGPLVIADGRCRGLHDLPAGASVWLDAETLTAAAAAIVESILDDGRAWLLLATPPGHVLPAAWAVRCDLVTLRVPALRERGAELPALARHLLATLSARRNGPPPTLTAAALDWLTAQTWPGDVAQLEATLGRGLMLAGAAPIDVCHLTGTAAAPPAGGDPRRAQLELLVAQLAHELRNPITALKTFAQLPGLAADAALRERFAALTDDTITRMDGLLENATAFARLGVPHHADVELGPLLDALVAEVRPVLAERAIAIEYTAPNGARCRADRAQLAYALRNVFAGVATEAAANDAVRIDAGAPGVVRVEFDDRRGTAEQLRRIALADDDPALLALPFALARAVLERNGGELAHARQSDGRALLELRLPAAGEAPPAPGPTANGG